MGMPHNRRPAFGPRRIAPAPRLLGTLALSVSLLLVAAPVFAQGSYTLFESVPVRPLALSADGTRLYAANTHDNRVEIFDVLGDGSLARAGVVAVGLEPVALAARGNNQLWVSNHLSDSVSLVDVSNPATARVVATILVGDEPRDIVVGGSAGNKIFVACAHRGQALPFDPQLTTPGVGRSDVWVIDADAPSAQADVVVLFGDKPRALAVTPDGSTVYAAILHSGSQTIVIPEVLVTPNGGAASFPPGSTPNQPETGLILKFDGSGNWLDADGRDWSSFVPFDLPDQDVFAIDADSDPPVETGFATGVGSMLFNMAVNPATGDVYVTNQDARNHVRFEPVLRGHIAEQRVSIISGSTPAAVHLNPHVDYSTSPGPPSERADSLGMPLDLVFNAAGTRAWIAAFGSGLVGEIDATGTVTNRITVGAGPVGVALHEGHSRLYVLNLFDKTISLVDTGSASELGTVALGYDPEPASVRDGRRFLYDTTLTSGHGDNSCATCHFSADMDRKAWNLGDPFGQLEPNPNPFPIIGSGDPFHPAKGPMTTQSLRGMDGAGSMHWRGDRNGGTGDPLNEDLSFKQFNGAFVGLMGTALPLTAQQMQAYTDFILQVRYPPNPVANLDGSLTAQQAAGANLFVNGNHDVIATCEGCHNLPLGTGGFSTFEGESQEFKVPHLRNAYDKLGEFNAAGPQVAESGFLHDGAIPTLFDFFAAPVFQVNDVEQRQLEAFMLAFDTGLAPAVGQQLTATPTNLNSQAIVDRIALLIARDEAGDCELVARGTLAGEQRGALYVNGGTFSLDINGEPAMAADDVRLLATVAGQEITYTCVPPGSGTRLALDRDEDGFFDTTETRAGSDPADPNSTPPAPPVCGDGVREGAEACDGNDLGGQTCIGLGYSGGVLACAVDCSFDESGCTSPPVCGDGVREGAEACDGNDLGGQTCTGLGYSGGALACAVDCSFDESGCSSANGVFHTRILKASRLNRPPGQHKIVLKSDALDGSGSSFTPSNEDFTVLLEVGNVVAIQTTIDAGDPGWQLRGSKWRWKAQRGIPHASGLSRVTLGISGNPFKVKIIAKDTDASGATGVSEFEITMTVGDDFWTGPTPPCATSSNGKTLRCR